MQPLAKPREERSSVGGSTVDRPSMSGSTADRLSMSGAFARRPSCVQQAGHYDYVLLSDVHLGSDIVTHLRPWAATSWLTREAEIDDQLITLLEHHRKNRQPDRPLCVVVAGDFLELVGISLSPPSDGMRTSPTREEVEHGLGSAPDHVVHKMRAIAARHPRVFRALMELIDEGNQLVLVRGNHDIELHWHAAQQAFIDAVTAHAPEARRAELATRIAIHPWFFVVENLLYVEHGHHFDPMCSYGDPLMPTCPTDSRRIRQVPFSVMLRNVARPTRGLSTASYEHVSFGAYLGLLLKLGIVGSARIAMRFARASARLLGAWRAHRRDRCHRRHHAAVVRKARFAAQSGLSAELLRTLETLYVRPAAHSLLFVLRSIYLDRVFALVSALAFVISGALLARYSSAFEGIVCALPATLFATYAVIGVSRDLVPIERMQTSASRIAELFDARYVVMGHTHHPVQADVGNGAQYVNLGHWGQDDLPEERSEHAESTRTYLHVRWDGASYRADLLRWDARTGASTPALTGDRNDVEPKQKTPRGSVLGGVAGARPRSA